MLKSHAIHQIVPFSRNLCRKLTIYRGFLARLIRFDQPDRQPTSRRKTKNALPSPAGRLVELSRD